jgi:VanZ family protein
MIRLIARAAAAVIATAIIVFTLGPIADRPQTGYPQLERFAAFLVLGAALAIGFPRQRYQMAAWVVVGAVGLEFAQLLVPGRDAGVPDAFAKALGGVVGVTTATAANGAVDRQA